VVVVGCPSLDRVVVGGRIRDVVGGAGFLTALAASVAGARVGLVARVPPELPESIGGTFGPGGLDSAGLTVAPGTLPSFHIVYDGVQEATYVQAAAGMEADLCAADMPGSWLSATIVHVASLGGSTAAQIEFVIRLRDRGFRGLVSAGTWSGAVREDSERVGELLQATDFFFLNRSEAKTLLPDGLPLHHRGVVCITQGAEGVEIHGGDVTRFRPPRAVDVVDPTGAGDSFCGAFLGATARGLDGVAAGLAVAGHCLSDWGGAATAALVARGVGPRARVDPDRVALVAKALRAAAEGSASSFSGFPFPEVGDPHAAATLAVATMHQYGFWTARAGSWEAPMDAVAGGREWRGSDFVWQAFTRAVAADPTVLDPARMADEPELFETICRADDGTCPLPDAASHSRLHQELGRALRDRTTGGWSGLLAEVRAAQDPTSALLEVLSGLPGYAEDPLAKKARLLALILGARPERFLGDAPALPGAIVDYHLMRGCLRTGIVEVIDSGVRDRMEARRWVLAAEEAAVRSACAEALDALENASGRTVGEIDGFFFRNGRSVCGQRTDPDCPACPIRDACAQRTSMFQPVFRTTAY
jgi:ribokinase